MNLLSEKIGVESGGGCGCSGPADHADRPWKLANRHVHEFIDEAVVLTVPDQIYWCNGTEYERQRLAEDLDRERGLVRTCRQLQEIVEQASAGDLEPGHYVCRSMVVPGGRSGDRLREHAGTAPVQEAVRQLFRGCMRGRTMYVVPLVITPAGSPPTVAIQVTDSIELAIGKSSDVQMGMRALRRLGQSGDFVRCLHSAGDRGRTPRRHVCHFTAGNAVWSFGAGPVQGGHGCPDCEALGLTTTRCGGCAAMGKRDGCSRDHTARGDGLTLHPLRLKLPPARFAASDGSAASDHEKAKTPSPQAPR